MKKVVVVGAGPAGLFAAEQLSGSFDVTVVEQAEFVGGAGLRSDGKFNFHPRVGGDLFEFLSEGEAWAVVEVVEKVFRELGVEEPKFNGVGLSELEARAMKVGMKFIAVRQSHVGSDVLPQIMERFKRRLEASGVTFVLGKRVEDLEASGGRIRYAEVDGEKIECDYIVLAPGRSGSEWLRKVAEKFRLKLKFNPIDIGVRVEVRNEVMDEIIKGYGCWDPKFHIRTPSYDDFVRTFCVCPSGFVVRENYGNSLFGVNGHSLKNSQSENTNFALLVRVSLTKPLENTTDYGRRIAQLTNTLGGGKPIIQRLGDLKKFRRSTWERLERSYVRPTLKDVTPGDIAMAYPNRILKDLTEGLEMLDKVAPGINSESTLLYAPEIKFYAMRVVTDRRLRTAIPNLFVAGDGAGVSRGIVGAAATGIIAAMGIREAEGLPPLRV